MFDSSFDVGSCSHDYNIPLDGGELKVVMNSSGPDRFENGLRSSHRRGEVVRHKKSSYQAIFQDQRLPNIRNASQTRISQKNSHGLRSQYFPSARGSLDSQSSTKSVRSSQQRFIASTRGALKVKTCETTNFAHIDGQRGSSSDIELIHTSNRRWPDGVPINSGGAMSTWPDGPRIRRRGPLTTLQRITSNQNEGQCLHASAKVNLHGTFSFVFKCLPKFEFFPIAKRVCTLQAPAKEYRLEGFRSAGTVWAKVSIFVA